MKQLKLSLVGALCTGLLTTTAYANIFVFSGGDEACKNIYGSWKGKGTVIADLKITKLKCDYHGDATVTGDNGKFDMHITLKKDTGLCPPEKTIDFAGMCENGAVKIKTDSADLNGSMGADGKSATVDGTVTFIYSGIPITAQLQNMQLQKDSKF